MSVVIASLRGGLEGVVLTDRGAKVGAGEIGGWMSGWENGGGGMVDNLLLGSDAATGGANSNAMTCCVAPDRGGG